MTSPYSASQVQQWVDEQPSKADAARQLGVSRNRLDTMLAHGAKLTETLAMSYLRHPAAWTGAEAVQQLGALTHVLERAAERLADHELSRVTIQAHRDWHIQAQLAPFVAEQFIVLIHEQEELAELDGAIQDRWRRLLAMAVKSNHGLRRHPLALGRAMVEAHVSELAMTQFLTSCARGEFGQSTLRLFERLHKSKAWMDVGELLTLGLLSGTPAFGMWGRHLAESYFDAAHIS